MAANPHLKFNRLPAYSPQPNLIEWFRKVRRRATHNRPSDASADLNRPVRAGLSYFQTVRDRAKTLLLSRRRRKKAKQAAPTRA